MCARDGIQRASTPNAEKRLAAMTANVAAENDWVGSASIGRTTM